jgi:hypothetical protein
LKRKLNRSLRQHCPRDISFSVFLSKATLFVPALFYAIFRELKLPWAVPFVCCSFFHSNSSIVASWLKFCGTRARASNDEMLVLLTELIK